MINHDGVSSKRSGNGLGVLLWLFSHRFWGLERWKLNCCGCGGSFSIKRDGGELFRGGCVYSLVFGKIDTESMCKLVDEIVEERCLDSEHISWLFCWVDM